MAPRTPIEEKVAEIWAEVLRVEQVGIHDDFFDLGGYSLLATQAMARTRATFQTELSLRRFFEAPTVADPAVAIAHGHVRLSAVSEMIRLVAEVEGLSQAVAHQLLGTERAAADKGKRHE